MRAILILKIRKFVSNKGYEYETEFDTEEVEYDKNFDFSQTNSDWSDSLIEECSKDVDFECWEEIVIDGEIVDESGHWWAKHNE